MTLTGPVSRDQMLTPGALQPAYQPIVELDTGLTVGYEALARWPDLRVTPEIAFDVAIQEGWVDLLDWTCHVAAVRGALAARLGRRQTLFVNAEPASFAGDPPPGLDRLKARVERELRLVVEITERALTESPAKLLQACRVIRSHGLGLALDDVGAVPESLALLPLMAPDVVKIDLVPTRGWIPRDRAHFMTALAAYAEQSGALILAEGIETERHLSEARILGATLGQGWYFGAAGPIGKDRPTARMATLAPRVERPVTTPTALLESSGRAQIASKKQLLGMSLLLEHQALSLRSPMVVLTALQDMGHFSAATASRYRSMAARCPLVVVFGPDRNLGKGIGFYTIPLDIDDPLRHEWVVLVLGAHYAAALLARDLGDQGPDRDRRFAYLLTHDRDLVIQAATSLLERVPADVSLASPVASSKHN
jgi:EAL domain-containing protein (putative c-di-GMP-specific phosphodiesterase class I)